MSSQSEHPHRDHIKQAVVDHVTEVSEMSKDAVVSTAWIYPVRGIIYFVSHPSLYRAVAPILFKSILVSLGIIALFFLFTYVPQALFLSMFTGPLGFVAAVPLVLGEAYAVVMVVTKAFYLGQAHEEIFDAVLLQQGQEALVAKGRTISKNSGGAKSIGKSITKPLEKFSKDGIVRYLISLPLNAIPVVGTVGFLLYNGIKAGPGYHSRYFQLKGWDSPRRDAFVHSRRGAYTAFGTIALALNLIPVVGLVFGFTSACGAALWANDLEKRSEAGGKDDTQAQLHLGTQGATSGVQQHDVRTTSLHLGTDGADL